MVRQVTLVEIKIAYDDARKKYKQLPTFESINRVFELGRVEYPEFVVRETRRLVVHYFQLFARDLEMIFNPNPGMPYSMVETSAFSKEEKHKIYEFYKKHWYYVHLGQIAGLEGDKQQAEFIAEAFKVWPKFKAEHLKLLKKATKEWQKKPVKETTGSSYVG
jgi:hypothetical protein